MKKPKANWWTLNRKVEKWYEERIWIVYMEARNPFTMDEIKRMHPQTAQEIVNIFDGEVTKSQKVNDVMKEIVQQIKDAHAIL